MFDTCQISKETTIVPGKGDCRPSFRASLAPAASPKPIWISECGAGVRRTQSPALSASCAPGTIKLVWRLVAFRSPFVEPSSIGSESIRLLLNLEDDRHIALLLTIPASFLYFLTAAVHVSDIREKHSVRAEIPFAFLSKNKYGENSSVLGSSRRSRISSRFLAWY
ncbi:hypothetical protein F4777DRAFT_576409 [Nemania sp. FL0916]|nr:hypothetical protein F4777DRAFT_576409 [Nemania sp. FL0916]